MPTGAEYRDQLVAAGLANGFRLKSKLEPVTVQRMNEAGEPKGSPVAVAQALGRAARCTMLLGDRFVAASQVKFWHLMAADLGFEPEKGMTVTTAAGVVWVTWEFETHNWGDTVAGRYRLTCYKG